MKLVEILARELEKWPEGCAAIVQNASGNFTYLDWLKVEFSCGQWDYAPADMRICDQRDRNFSRELAEDHSTAIITREMWEAERAKLKEGKTVKANKDGWIRHRGGKCPVENGALVDVRYRQGIPGVDGFTPNGLSAASYCWHHIKDNDDIMAYRLHKPEREEIVAKLQDECEAVVDLGNTLAKAGPLAWRDRIHKIDAASKDEEARHCAAMEAFDKERDELVAKLAAEGLALCARPADVVVDMSDPEKWLPGDLLECIDCGAGSLYTEGKLYEFIRLSDWGSARTIDNTGVENGIMPHLFRWHSRPTV